MSQIVRHGVGNGDCKICFDNVITNITSLAGKLVSKMRLIRGNNGGLFFLSTHSWTAWRKSLEFYKGVTLKGRVKRMVLCLAYHVLASNCSCEEMAERIETATGCRPDVRDECSGIISPTGDKAVVHIHGKGYWKAATGASYPKVKGEVEIYRLLSDKRPVKFGFSDLFEIHDDGKHISFFMKEEPNAFCGDIHKPIEAVLPALEEFHAVTGLVHGDFKPWNVRWRKDGRPQFFDFEVAHPGDIQEDIDFYRTWGGLRK